MKRARGFSIIEVLIVIVIIGILVAAAIPSFTIWIQNTQIRTGAEALINGMQTAKNEAVRRNRCIQILIENQTGWRVNPCDDPDADPPLASRSSAEGSANAATVMTPPGAAIVSFTALGRVMSINPSDGSAAITQIDIDNPTMLPADSRELRLVIPTGGGVRLCDPNPGVAIGDPRRCT
jgi:type IV fimbrial biogenesis protein FimT